VALERYPDPAASELREIIARRTGCRADEVLLGVGSDELITLLLTACARPRRPTDAVSIVTTTPTFVMYKHGARVRGQRVLEVPLDAAWEISLEGLLRAIEVAEPRLVFLATPNNPTGTMPSRERLEKVILAAARSLVVIDEAYIDYAAHGQLEFLREHENVVVLRTLSKVGFAALRVGCEAALAAIPGVSVTPSQGNFLWFRTERPAGEVFAALAERGVLVRTFHERGGRLAHQVRVTVGAPHENDVFLSSLREVA
jgi:histidinol-phosphate aminotransferase